MKNILSPRYWIAASVAGSLGLISAGCSGDKKPSGDGDGAGAGGGDKEKVLHVYNWDDYISEDLVAKFEKEQGCKVVIDTFDSNEAMFAKLKAGAGGYDILVPSSYMVKILKREGMIRELDKAKLPNLKHIDGDLVAAFAFDKEMMNSVPYMVAATGIGYIDGEVGEVVDSWKMLDNPALKGRITLLNDYRETIGAALKSLGYSLNTTDDAELEKAKEVVIGWKKNIAKFESDQYNQGLASGEFLVCHGYAGDIFQAKEENEKVRIIIPKEGTSIAMDELCIPKDAPEAELAHAFINFLCDPENAAENSNYIYYLAPNKDAYALIDDALKAEPVIMLAPEVRKNCEVVDDLGEDNLKYSKIWDAIKAAE